MSMIKTSYIILFFALYSFAVKAVEKGSNTLLSIKPSFNFPVNDSDNQMLMFGYFKNGFGLLRCYYIDSISVNGSMNIF